MFRNLAAALCAIVVVSVGLASGAQAYPDRPIHIIVPYSPGGGADIIARLIGQRLSANIGQSVVIDNRAGANGNIGSDVVAKSAPDGYTLLMNTIGLVFSQSIYKKLPFNVLKDLEPVVSVAGTPYIPGLFNALY
jgi:tripartite-type tricarboxylate transporter receptor subunit TctC